VKIFRTKQKNNSSKSEHLEQRAVINWAWISSKKWPQYSIVVERKINGAYIEATTLPVVAIPNGGRRDKIGAVMLRAEGLRKGFPDLIVPVSVGEYIGLAIEMKKRDGVPSDIKDNQKTWLDFLELQGWKSVVCFGADHAIEQITKYLDNSCT
jgi:hypothetical protein